jgi:PEP-CTERM motif-containing protein
MNKRLLVGALAVAAFGTGAAPAGAQVISIGLQEAGFNGDAIMKVAGPGAPAVSASGFFGTFDYQVIGSDFSGTNLGSASTLFSVTGLGTLNVFVSEVGLTVASSGGTFESALTQNQLSPGDTATLSTWLDPNNAPYGMTIQLAGNTFTAIGTFAPPDGISVILSGPYSLTEEYQVTLNPGDLMSLSTISIATAGGGGGIDPFPPIPEPSTWAMMGIGFAALAGMAAGRRTGHRLAV